MTHDIPNTDTNAMIAERDDLISKIKVVPSLLYGTAFKGARTASVVTHALEAGFVGIDTAAMTRAYQEKLVGEAVRGVVGKGVVKREEIWVSAFFDLLSAI
jgi:diketogulonate reductase-like aldo/keto reductase